MKSLDAGALTLQTPEDARRQFGLVAAHGPTGASGTVRVSLRVSPPLRAQMDEGGCAIDLPEAWAEALARALAESALRLRHLRALHRFGLLTPAALVDTEDTPAPPEQAIAGWTAPRPKSDPSLAWEGARCVLRYEADDGSAVALAFDAAESARIERRAEAREGSSPDGGIAVTAVERASGAAFCYGVRFAAVTVEVIASGVRRIGVTPPGEEV